MKNIVLVIVFVVLAFTGLFGEFPRPRPSPEKISLSVISKCQNSPVKEVCYEEEIPKLMRYLSMEETFEVTQIVQNNVPDFPYCHVLGHKVASIETKKNPADWKSVMARCPSGVCSNGCVHGAFQERYKFEDLSKEEFAKAKKDFETVCEKGDSFNPTGLEQGSCYHALGHLMMYLTKADISLSVDACDDVALKSDGRDFRNVCYAGAFMQIFQPLDTDDKSLVSKFTLNSNNVWEFCSGFTEAKRNSCWEETWPIFLEKISIGRGLIDFCAKLGKGSERCTKDLLYIMPIQFRFNTDSINRYCKGLPQDVRGMCFAMTASRLLEIDKRNGDKTVDFCTSLEKRDMDICLNQVVKDAAFDFNKDSEEFYKVCSRMPQPWQDKCFENE